MKKFLSILLAAMMLFAMVGTAFAAEKVTVSITNTSVTHTFTAYQIFTGTQSATETEGGLADIEWGTGVDSDTDADANGVIDLVDDMKVAFPDWGWPEDMTTVDAEAVAALLKANDSDKNAFAKFMHNNVSGSGIAIAASESMDIEVGYYLIVDTSTIGAEDNDAYNASLLQITGTEDGINITKKTDKPSQEKKVWENVDDVKDTDDAKWDYTGAKGEDYNDVADYSIGDDVYFAIYSTVPNMNDFDTYKMIFHDVMDPGLVFNGEDSVTVKVNGTPLTASEIDVRSGAEVEDGCTFEVEIKNLKAVAGVNEGQTIQIDFSAKLTGADVVIGLNGNENKSRLEYSNNPNEEDSTTNTPWDYVVVFTYQLDVSKVDGKEVALPGATFVLYREVEKTVEGATATVKEYVKVDANGKVTGWTEDEMDAACVLTSSDPEGTFSVIGLDDGTYYLKETDAPDGFNILTAPITVVIDATTEHQAKYEQDATKALKALNVTITDVSGTDTATGNLSDGSVAATVVNNKGASLPETGGIGTTLFYLFGSIMAAGSALILVVRRRAEAEEE